MNIRDIARISGVGVSTVSRVLNNHPDVKESTRENVLRVIKESNYVPNNSARILKQNNTKNIGVLVKGVFNPFFSELINVIGSKINEHKYTMILQQNDYVLEQEVESIISFVKEKRLQGIICLGGNFIDLDDDSFKNITSIEFGDVYIYNDEYYITNYRLDTETMKKDIEKIVELADEEMYKNKIAMKGFAR